MAIGVAERLSGANVSSPSQQNQQPTATSAAPVKADSPTSEANEPLETTRQKAAKGDQVAKRKLAKLKGSNAPVQVQSVSIDKVSQKPVESKIESSGAPAAAAQGKGIGVSTVA